MSFSADISGFKKNAVENTEKARRRILFTIFRAVIMDTPVLEGTLRGNWQMGNGSPQTGELSLRDQAAVMNEINSILKATRMGDTVYLNNNLPYAYPIEFYGWSHTKAPQGMVRKNVIRVNKIAAAVSRSLRNGSV